MVDAQAAGSSARSSSTLPAPAPERPIDRALSHVARGEPAEALRYAIPLLEQEPRNALRCLVLGRALSIGGRSAVAERVLRRAIDLAVEQSNLPLAVAAAAFLDLPADEKRSVFEPLAQAFARGSERLSDRRVVPPSFPAPAEAFEPLPESVDAEALLGRAERVVPEDSSSAEFGSRRSLLPQPLFSTLIADDLCSFMSIFDARVVEQGTCIIEEGELGDQAFVVARGEFDVQKRGARDGEEPVHLARVGAGALIGEMALLSRAPRVATVVAARPGIVLIAQKSALDQLVSRAPEIGRRFADHCKRRMVENLVRTSEMFRAASPGERPALVERFVLRTFEPGEKLATQGVPSEGLFLIASGDVAIQHVDGAERTLVAKLGPGDVVGEIALVFRRSSVADAVAQQPTVTLCLPRERFPELVRFHQKVFCDLYELAAKRDQEIEFIAQEEATEGEDFVIV
ncbi:MAG TPA: cyclic nucleotide-binding domain-containing protein [Polyangiaceae bacterium]|nr:cyclic nucleotide-binding domain-containing protein [Polyangiaceae bacterium]